MRIINIIKCDEAAFKALKEIEDTGMVCLSHLYHDFSPEDKAEYQAANRDGFEGDYCNLICKKTEDSKGRYYSIRGEEKNLVMEYSDIPALFRGILYLFSGFAKDEGPEIQTGQSFESRNCFKDFGIMIDTSRNAVPKVETVKKVMLLCALMGYSYVGLYMEDTLRIKNEPYFGYMRGAYTKKEIEEMDGFALTLGLELRPFIQTLAHFNQLARYEEYQKSMDAEDILLVGDDRANRLINNLLETVAEEFSCKKVHIGMDEAFLLGAGKYQALNGLEKRNEIMKKQLSYVLPLCKKLGIEPSVWGDMFRNYAEDGKWIPEGLEIVYWDYYSTDRDHYEKELDVYKGLTDKVAFAGGAWKWTGMIPSNRFSIETGRESIEACRNKGVDSYVVTCWGDNGAEASIYSVLPVFFEDSKFAWGDALDDTAFEFLTGISLEDFLTFEDVNPAVNEKTELRPHNNSKYLFYNDILMGTFDSLLKGIDRECFEKTAGKLHALGLSGVKSIKNRKPVCLDECLGIMKSAETFSSVLSVKAFLGKDIYEAYRNGDREKMAGLVENIDLFLKKTDAYYDSFKEQWMTENKSFGFEIQTARIGALRKRTEDVLESINDYLEGRISELAELEEEHLDFNYFDEKDPDKICYNMWSNMISFGVMG